MLWAGARSVREERSRQRFALQDFSLIRVSLIKGKAGWKVGSAESVANYFMLADSKEGRQRIASIIKLVRQFVHGEVADADLFADVKTALARSVDATARMDDLVTVFSLRFLNRLGYIASPQRFAAYLEADEWWRLSPVSAEARAALEKAKLASHL